MNRYCPSCRDEFRSEIEICPDCGVPLLAGPPPDADARAAEHTVELIRTRDRLTLNRLVGLLDDAGIVYELGEGIVLSAIVGDIAQPIRVLVLEGDEVKAREIVAALEGAELAEGELAEESIDSAAGDESPEAIKPN